MVLLGFPRGQRPHSSSRYTEDERPRRYPHSLRDQATRPHQRLLPDPGTAQDDRPNPDERPIAHDATMQTRLMADHDVVAHETRLIVIHMEQAQILDVRPAADANPIDVRAQDRVEPNAGVRANPHIPDELGAWSDPGARMHLRPSTTR